MENLLNITKKYVRRFLILHFRAMRTSLKGISPRDKPTKMSALYVKVIGAFVATAGAQGQGGTQTLQNREGCDLDLRKRSPTYK